MRHLRRGCQQGYLIIILLRISAQGYALSSGFDGELTVLNHRLERCGG